MHCRSLFTCAAALLGIASLGIVAPAKAQTATEYAELPAISRTECIKILGPSGLGKTSLLCCLAQIDAVYRGDPSLTPEQREAVNALEAEAIARLKALGSPDQPRVCPVGPGNSFVLYPPPPPPPNPPLRRLGPPGQPPRQGFGSLPGIELSFGIGTLITQSSTDVPTGGGTFQRFPSDPFSGAGLDLRLSWLLTRAATNTRPEFDRVSSALLSMFIGYNYLRSQVTEFTNIGGRFNGITNTTFRGHTTVSRPYLGLGMDLPLNGGQPFGSLPALSAHIAGTVGYSWVKVSDDVGPFSNTEQGFDFGLEVGLNVPLQDSWTVTPMVSGVFRDNQKDKDVRFEFKIAKRF